MARYRFLTNEDSLGAGGFGSVHPCCEVDEDGTFLNDRLAVKPCIVEDDEDPDEKYRRFRNGGRLGKRLRHPNVMPVIASGDRKRDGTPFIVMPHADGGNLEDWLAIRRSEEERVDVFRQVLEAIAFAHTQRILHRDINRPSAAAPVAPRPHPRAGAVPRLHRQGQRVSAGRPLWVGDRDAPRVRGAHRRAAA